MWSCNELFSFLKINLTMQCMCKTKIKIYSQEFSFEECDSKYIDQSSVSEHIDKIDFENSKTENLQINAGKAFT